MADRIFFKAMLVGLLFFGFVLSGYSQANAPQKGTDRSSQTTTTPVAGADRTQTTAKTVKVTPAMKAVELNVAEVEAGKMASEKAMNPRVKEFADLMVKDHTDALTKLRAVSGAPTDMKPNAKHQQTADRLSQLSGTEFDREYMKAMVTDHQEAVKFLEQQSGRARSGKTNAATGSTPTDQSRAAAGGSTDLASVSQELLPTVQHHLQLAKEIQKELQNGGATKTTRQPNSTTNSDGRAKPTPDQNSNQK